MLTSGDGASWCLEDGEPMDLLALPMLESENSATGLLAVVLGDEWLQWWRMEGTGKCGGLLQDKGGWIVE